MDIIKSTRKYESWLGGNTPVIQSELDLKHKNMAENPFSFFRATFYRWVQLFNENIENIDSIPAVLAVGDLHVENFGTWRDLEGRLVWGVNDFDESYYQPYINDLIRLTASAHLAIEENHLKMGKSDACDIILKGYEESITAGGRAFVLNELHKWLHDTATFRLKEPVKFWDKLTGFDEVKKDIPKGLVKTLLKNMPGHSPDYKVIQRIAGLGSLGRQRLVVISNWEGGLLAREAKAYVPSAYTFVNKKTEEGILIIPLIKNAVRCHDPYFFIKKKYIIRRLAPDCSRIEIESLPQEHDEQKLLYSMGWETANIHLANSKSVKAIKKDLSEREKHWLHKSAEKMLDAVKADFSEWQKEYNSKK
jgi:hypothetical protein